MKSKGRTPPPIGKPPSLKKLRGSALQAKAISEDALAEIRKELHEIRMQLIKIEGIVEAILHKGVVSIQLKEDWPLRLPTWV